MAKPELDKMADDEIREAIAESRQRVAHTRELLLRRAVPAVQIESDQQLMEAMELEQAEMEDELTRRAKQRGAP